MKTCTQCKEVKSLEFFCSNKRKKDGLHYYCKTCTSLLNKTYKKQWRKNGGALKEKNSLLNSPLRFSAHKIRNLIRNTLTQSGYSKKTKTCEILGAEFNIVRQHIESKFVDGMNWENHGKWHIDHIVPVSSAKDETTLIQLNHYENLQPLWASENLRKGAKIHYTTSLR